MSFEFRRLLTDIYHSLNQVSLFCENHTIDMVNMEDAFMLHEKSRRLKF